MRPSSMLPLAIGFLFSNGCSEREPAAVEHHAQEEVELAPFMGRLQVFSQKLGYSIEAQNPRLIDISLHELEETAEEIVEHVPEHDGYPIADLAKATLVKAIGELEQVMGKGSWQERRHGYEALAAACDSCHTATQHD